MRSTAFRYGDYCYYFPDEPFCSSAAAVAGDLKCLVFFAVERLPSLSEEEWAVFLSQLSSALVEPSTSAHPSSSSPTHSAATAIRSRLNLLCYLCSVVWQKAVANRLINSTVVGQGGVWCVGLAADEAGHRRLYFSVYLCLPDVLFSWFFQFFLMGLSHPQSLMLIGNV